MERIRESSPRLKARVAGLFYLLIFVLGIFTEFFVRGKLVAYHDAALTSTNILAHPSLYRMGGTFELLILTCDIAVALLFFDLFRPVSRVLSLFATAFRLVFVAMMAVNVLIYFAPLILLRSANFPTAFKQTLVLGCLQLYGVGYGNALVFFGLHCLLIGYLIFRSSFLPPILGILMALAGVGWLTFLWPPLANSLRSYVLIPGLLGEGLLTLWLLVVGVDAQRWIGLTTTAKEPQC